MAGSVRVEQISLTKEPGDDVTFVIAELFISFHVQCFWQPDLALWLANVLLVVENADLKEVCKSIAISITIDFVISAVIESIVDNLGGTGCLADALIVEQRSRELQAQVQEGLQVEAFVITVALLTDGEGNLDQPNVAIILANAFFIVQLANSD